MRKYSILIIMLLLGAFSTEARHYDRGYETVPSSPFVKKGTWVAGGTAKYSQHINSDYNFLVFSNINSVGYSVAVRPKLIYMFKDNMGAGLSVSYNRSMLDLSSGDLAISEIAMNAKDCYQIQHKYTASAIFRAYIPLGDSKRVAMFADLSLGGSYKQGKAFNAGGEYVIGTYKDAYSLELTVDPGIVVFLSERLAVEANVGVFGVSYSWMSQFRNQVYGGYYNSTSAGFMVNLLSLGIGISYYFL